ncbi:MAG: mechanosensitive ion channel domain-containing protein [Pseudomonadota bacterium]
MEWIVLNLANILLAGIILIAGFLVAGWAKRVIVDQGYKYESLDDTLFVFGGSLARYAIVAATIIAVLSRFGVETTSFVAVIGAAGLAIGLALQGTLSNVAAGVMLMIFRPFKLEQYIEAAGHAGTVKEINLFTTELATPDNVQIIVPNGAIWSGSIVNYSHHDTRRVDLVFGVGYGANLKTAEATICKVIEADERALEDPAPFCAVTNLGDSSVDFTVRVWCEAGDYWALKFDLTRAVKDALDKAKIDIPFPTRTIVQA